MANYLFESLSSRDVRQEGSGLTGNNPSEGIHGIRLSPFRFKSRH